MVLLHVKNAALQCIVEWHNSDKNSKTASLTLKINLFLPNSDPAETYVGLKMRYQ